MEDRRKRSRLRKTADAPLRECIFLRQIRLYEIDRESQNEKKKRKKKGRTTKTQAITINTLHLLQDKYVIRRERIRIFMAALHYLENEHNSCEKKAVHSYLINNPGPVTLNNTILSLSNPLSNLLSEGTGLFTWKQWDLDVLSIVTNLLDWGNNSSSSGTKSF